MILNILVVVGCILVLLIGGKFLQDVELNYYVKWRQAELRCNELESENDQWRREVGKLTDELIRERRIINTLRRP